MSDWRERASRWPPPGWPERDHEWGEPRDLSFLDRDEPSRSACWKSHPRLAMGGGVVVGGAARHPPPDADVYVQLETAPTPPLPHDGTPPRVANFKIPNYGVPPMGPTINLAEVLGRYLSEGFTIHVGCVGGHGRTGLLIACLRHLVEPGRGDQVEWVRENYCRRAVEGRRQEDFVREFQRGVDKFPGAR